MIHAPDGRSASSARSGTYSVPDSVEPESSRPLRYTVTWYPALAEPPPTLHIYAFSPPAPDPATATNITKQTTDTNGKASFAGLADGDYFLLETVAPTGYVKLTDPISVTIDGSSSLTSGLSNDQIKTALSPVSHVANTPGTSLPSTGGIGTTIFYVVGSILVVGAGVILITRRRMTREN